MSPIIYHSKTSSHPRRGNSVLEFEKAVLDLVCNFCNFFYKTNLIFLLQRQPLGEGARPGEVDGGDGGDGGLGVPVHGGADIGAHVFGGRDGIVVAVVY